MDLAVPRDLRALYLSDPTVRVMNGVDDWAQSIALNRAPRRLVRAASQSQALSRRLV